MRIDSTVMPWSARMRSIGQLWLRAAVDRVIGEIACGFGQDIEADHFLELFEIGLAGIEAVEIVFDVVKRNVVVLKFRLRRGLRCLW